MSAGKTQPADANATIVCLLDANDPLALTWPQHVHSALAHPWFGELCRRLWATCAITQLEFVRMSSKRRFVADAVTPGQAPDVLLQLLQVPGHVYWPEQHAPAECPILALQGVVGHRQVTDAYLLALAPANGGKVATLDRGKAGFANVNGLADVLDLIAPA